MQNTLFHTVRNAFYNANLTNGLTKIALAKNIGASEQMVGKWLKNEKSFSTISLDNLRKLCEILELELEIKKKLP